MLMGFVTTVFIGFGFCSCTANEDNPATPEQQQHDYSKVEAYGLTYHNFDGTDDVKILDADTTEIAVKKSLADKLGIKSFVNHPIGIWDAPSHLAYGQFIQNIVDFLIVAFCIFLMLKGINKLNRKKEEPKPAEPEAPKGPTQEELLAEIRDLLKKK